MKNIETELQKTIDSEMRKKDTASMVLAAKTGDGSLEFAGAGGTARPESSFFIASITKMFTASVILQLADEGLIDLESPITVYLPDLNLDGIHVHNGSDYSATLNTRHLLNHTSGLADYYENGLLDEIKDGRDRAFDIHDALEMIRGKDPASVPDSGKAHYSDTNYQLLGAIIESVTASPLPDVFRKRVIGRLGLKHTYVFGHSEPLEAPLPLYLKDRRMDFPRALSSMPPDGGIVSNTGDLIRFLQAYFAGGIFAKANFSWIRKFVPMFFPMQYGLGLWRFQIPRWMNLFRKTPEFLGHSGSTGSFAFYEPGRDLFLAGSFNQMDNPARPYQLMMKIAAKVPARKAKV